ncbi:MAG: hypothetical protein KDA89_07890, partial [Planctomycetaceae bacterium]|nr:hypothetical protein [Planctomycetaceae bacterium]
MVIRYTCEKCSAVLKINDDLAGSKGKCPKCKTTFVIPAPETDEDSDPEIEVPVADTKKNSAPIP